MKTTLLLDVLNSIGMHSKDAKASTEVQENVTYTELIGIILSIASLIRLKIYTGYWCTSPVQPESRELDFIATLPILALTLI